MRCRLLLTRLCLFELTPTRRICASFLLSCHSEASGAICLWTRKCMQRWLIFFSYTISSDHAVHHIMYIPHEWLTDPAF